MLVEDHALDQLGYDLKSAAEKLNMPKTHLLEAAERYRLHIYRFKGRDYMPAGELVRLQYLLLGEAAHAE